MAHNARKEDYQRLGLAFSRSLEEMDPLSAAKAFAGFGQRYAQDRDGLPQTDADRAFNLVALATDVIDYQLPFAAENAGAELIERGHQLLGEALSLDPNCFDAQRMESSSRATSISERFAFLAEKVDEVQRSCEAARDAAFDERDPERSTLAGEIAMRPYWRWLACMAEEALIIGRNHKVLELGERLLESDPHDSCDVRFTMAYAYAKLEDEAGLDALASRYPKICPKRTVPDAWMTLARIALAHRRHDMGVARRLVSELLQNYPSGARMLIRQGEIPDGEFSRLYVEPYSEDEIILAISEGIVLLQDGNDRSGRGVLGTWLAQVVSEMCPKAAAAEAAWEAEEEAR